MNRSGIVVAVLVLGVIGLVAVVNTGRSHEHRAAPAPSTSSQPRQRADPGRCASAVGGYLTEDFGVTIGGFAIRPVRAVASRCSDGTGVRHPSLVTVIDSDDNARVIATLIPTTQNVHVTALTVTGLTVTISFTEGASGALYRQSFTSTDGTTYRPGTPSLLFRACTPRQLRLTVSGTAPDAVVLRVENVGSNTCVVEGYPTVAASPVPADAGSPAARPELLGHTGGVHTATAPPIVQLSPGHTASAAVDSATGATDGGAALCTSVRALAVGLGAVTLGTVPARIRVCDFQVHPWVPGLTGSD